MAFKSEMVKIRSELLAVFNKVYALEITEIKHFK